ncbi:MAG: VTT domain-containing protein [Marinosulfonomonas sp.]|nr:VTT domain-containing protein [Marinosulfonomonas sp.]
MSDTLLAMIPDYGLWLVAITTFLSCLALPVPASLMMIGGGAFAAAGDFALTSISAVAYLGAVAGDQTGFAIGQRGSRLFASIRAKPGKRADLLQRAEHFFDKWGGPGVFLSRWLVSPLGPYINFIGGAAQLNWLKFTAWGFAGEAIWVGLYTGLGYFFSGQIAMVADIAANISGLLAALAGAAVLGWLIFRPHGPARP